MGAALAYALSRVDELNEQLLAAGADPVLPADLTFVGDAFDRAVDAQAAAHAAQDARHAASRTETVEQYVTRMAARPTEVE